MTGVRVTLPLVVSAMHTSQIVDVVPVAVLRTGTAIRSIRDADDRW
jgi:hypothetical protein